jgi:acyl dehydratase
VSFASLDEMKAAVGTSLGYSRWIEVDQRRINTFADATEDHQWIHVDPAKAAAGPFGATVAHGFLTLSLVAAVIEDRLRVEGVRMAVNYGLNRVRFPAPAPVGSKLRGETTLVAVDEVDGGGVQITYRVTIEREGGDRPVCVAECVARIYF